MPFDSSLKIFNYANVFGYQKLVVFEIVKNLMKEGEE